MTQTKKTTHEYCEERDEKSKRKENQMKTARPYEPLNNFFPPFFTFFI